MCQKFLNIFFYCILLICLFNYVLCTHVHNFLKKIVNLDETGVCRGGKKIAIKHDVTWIRREPAA